MWNLILHICVHYRWCNISPPATTSSTYIPIYLQQTDNHSVAHIKNVGSANWNYSRTIYIYFATVLLWWAHKFCHIVSFLIAFPFNFCFEFHDSICSTHGRRAPSSSQCSLRQYTSVSVSSLGLEYHNFLYTYSNICMQRSEDHFIHKYKQFSKWYLQFPLFFPHNYLLKRIVRRAQRQYSFSFHCSIYSLLFMWTCKGARVQYSPIESILIKLYVCCRLYNGLLCICICRLKRPRYISATRTGTWAGRAAKYTGHTLLCFFFVWSLGAGNFPSFLFQLSVGCNGEGVAFSPICVYIRRYTSNS